MKNESAVITLPKKLFKKKRSMLIKESHSVLPKRLEPSDNTFYTIEVNILAEELIKLDIKEK